MAQKEIIDIEGNKTSVECIGCALENGVMERPGGAIVLTEKFGSKMPSVQPIMEYARDNLKTPENLQRVGDAVEKLKIALSEAKEIPK